MTNQLKALIRALEVMDDDPNNKELKKVIVILKSMPAEKANDNTVSGNMIALLTYMPHLVTHSRSGAFKALFRELRPTQITNVPAVIWDEFMGVIPEQKPRLKK